MKRFYLYICALVGITAIFGLSGCQKEKKSIYTGTVNTSIILQQDDEYKKLSEEYLKERLKASAEVKKILSKSMDKDGVLKDKAAYDKLIKIEDDMQAKWQKKTGDYQRAKMEEVRKACEEVVKEKELDIVLAISEDNPRVEFGTHDITDLVLAKMPGFAGKAPEKTSEKTPEKAGQGG